MKLDIYHYVLALIVALLSGLLVYLLFVKKEEPKTGGGIHNQLVGLKWRVRVVDIAYRDFKKVIAPRHAQVGIELVAKDLNMAWADLQDYISKN